MSEQLENSVRETLKTETWTRAGIANFTMTNLEELEALLNQARSENCENSVKDICDETLSRSKESIVALYLSGMIAVRTGSIDTTNISALFDIFEKNHKEQLIEHVCDSILADDPQNKLALRKLAEFYKNSNNDKVWELYEKIVKLDFEEADIAKILADRYESQGNAEAALNYYKKAIQRYVALKNINSVKSIWSILVEKIPEEIDFFLSVQRKVAKTISADKSALLLQELYTYYKDTAKWDTAISILKIILEIDSKDADARREIAECFRGKYSDRAHLEDYIRSSNLTMSVRNVFEAINDFEKHIAFDAKNYVYHRTWGVGMITKVEGDNLVINFGKKTGVHSMTLKMAVKALQPLAKDHIWVYKKTVRKEELAKKIIDDKEWALKTIIKSFSNNCSEKMIKAEIVPSILTAGQWTSWHNKAKSILETNPLFAVNPNDINYYTVRDHELTPEEKLVNEFKADKDFFHRIEMMIRYLSDVDDPSDEQFSDMYAYFAGYLKSFTQVNVQVVASYLVVQEILRRVTSLENPAKFSFGELYEQIENPREIYVALKDSKKVANLRTAYLKNIRLLPDWDDQYVNLFPIVLDKSLIEELVAQGKKDKVTKLVQDCFNDYRLNRNAAVYLADQCDEEPWFQEAGIPLSKQLVTFVNIISVCYREIANHVNTVENKKTIRNAKTFLFERKKGDETVNVMLNYMLENDKDVITRMYTMVNDLTDLETSYKAHLRNGILAKYEDFKFQEAEIKQEAPKGVLVTAKMLEEKRALAEDIEKVQLAKIAQEVAEAKEKGDLKENAEYIAAREAQSRLNKQLGRLKDELARAVVFDPTTVTTSMVSFGTTVTLQDNVANKEIVYTILGPWESNAEEGIISYMSPLANNLLNMKNGEQKKFEFNDRQFDFTVKSIVPAKF